MLNGIDKVIASIGKRRGQLFVDRDITEKFSAGFYFGSQLSLSSTQYYNEYFALLYLLRGEGLYTDHKGQIHHLTPGSLAIRHPGSTHGLERTTPNKWYEFSCAVPLSLYKALLKAEVVTPDMYCIHPGVSVSIIEKALGYVEALSQQKKVLTAYSIFFDLFNQILSASIGQVKTDEESNTIEQAKLMLHEDLHLRMNIPLIAQKLGFGYENFRKIFTSKTGVSPGNYRIRLRIELADTMLLQTDMLIKEIALSLGYKDCPDFARQYRKFKGMNPTQFREEKKPR